MNLRKIGTAALSGFLLGMATAYIPRMKANPQQTGLIHVSIVPVHIPDAKNLASQDLPGNQIAGISCIPKPQGRLQDAAVCYVATTPLVTHN